MTGWNIKVERINFGLGGTPELVIEKRLREVMANIDGEIQDVIYTNPGDIQKAVVFIVFKGTYKEPVVESKPNTEKVEKGGIKAEITKEE